MSTLEGPARSAFGPDGDLYAVAGTVDKIIAYPVDVKGEAAEIAGGIHGTPHGAPPAEPIESESAAATAWEAAELRGLRVLSIAIN